ncbi:MAG: hypothetical protein HeimC2_00340 [Candidatus Heimdallarchaeota archaeon LC_2]|nr:MAG: hypothetical protein HeimC2_00340 [Candidatus Heimdallarchaeota archaeon LC_2]
MIKLNQIKSEQKPLPGKPENEMGNYYYIIENGIEFVKQTKRILTKQFDIKEIR